MTLKQWVAEAGGPSKAAARLGVTYDAIYRYLNGSRIPRPHIMEKIVKLSGGRVSYAHLVRGK